MHAQPHLTFCDPVDCSQTGFSVHGIFQTTILEWVAIFSTRGSSWPRAGTPVSCIGSWILYLISHHGSPTRWWAPCKGDSVCFHHLSLSPPLYPQHLVECLVCIRSSIKICCINGRRGTSLVVQCLRLWLPVQGAQVQSLVRELDPTCHN